MAISRAKLRKLEQLLYDRAVEGDSRTGLTLLKLHEKDIALPAPKNRLGVIFLPEVDFEPIEVAGVIPTRDDVMGDYMNPLLLDEEGCDKTDVPEESEIYDEISWES